MQIFSFKSCRPSLAPVAKLELYADEKSPKNNIYLQCYI